MVNFCHFGTYVTPRDNRNVRQMAEYLYTAMQQTTEDTVPLAQRRPPVYPVSGFDFSVLGPMRPANPVSDRLLVINVKLLLLYVPFLFVNQSDPLFVENTVVTYNKL
jgi:hypothetical protein